MPRDNTLNLTGLVYVEITYHHLYGTSRCPGNPLYTGKDFELADKLGRCTSCSAAGVFRHGRSLIGDRVQLKRRRQRRPSTAQVRREALLVKRTDRRQSPTVVMLGLQDRDSKPSEPAYKMSADKKAGIGTGSSRVA
jgi:hypothetical protein